MYEMRLHEEPFNLIKNDIKKIEYRLNDEKRKLLKVGDTITFLKRPDLKEKITVQITALKYYPNLYDMYKDTFDMYLKDIYSSVSEAVCATSYYEEAEIEKYGCVAIFFTKINS